jgi:hypothetical protein
MKIVYFETATSRSPLETTLEALVRSIRTSDILRRKTEDYRAALIADKDRAARMKRDFAGFLPAAIVSEKRDRAHVTALTGLVMCDFDHVPLERLDEVRQKVNQDPHTVLSYITLSGEGLRVLAKIPTAGWGEENKNSPTQGETTQKKMLIEADHHYQRFFNAINAYYASLTGLEFDPACKDLSRLSFAAYDPTAFYREEAKATTFTGEELDIKTDEDRRKEREKKKAEKAQKKEMNKQSNQIYQVFRRCIEPQLKKDGEVYGPGTHNRYVMRVGYLLNKYGFDLAAAQQWAVNMFHDYEKTESVIASCYKRTTEHGEWADRIASAINPDEKKRKPIAYRDDIIQFLHEKVDIRHNLILGRTEMRWKNPPYRGIASMHSKDRSQFTADTDAMVRSLCCLLETERGIDASKEKMYDVIENDCVEEFDPLTYYLHHLPAWDPDKDPDYLAELADTVHLVDDTDTHAHELWTKWLKKWMVGMLAGWVSSKEVNQTILTFVGAQGTYKSTWFKYLMPPQLDDYFKIKQNGDLSKDDVIAMSRYGLILHEELDVMTGRESNFLKALSTAQHSEEREAYGRTPRHRDNIASLCATGNNDRFLTNEQGTRRFIVFRVEVVKSPIEHPFNYEGIYSQAYYLLRHGFQYYFDKEEQRELEFHNLQFEVVNPLEEAVDMWMRIPQPTDLSVFWMRPSQLADWLSGRSKAHTRYDANRVGRVLTEKGYPKTKRNGLWGYKVILMDYDEAERRLKQLAVMPEEAKEETKEEEVKDITDLSQDVQTMYRRLLGEKDEDEE